MLRSLYSAVSGIDVNQKAMDVIGNNIANVNTIGFKQGRAVFQDMLSQTLQGGKSPSDSRGGVNPRQVGTGAYLVAVDNIFQQGVVKPTARTHDLAIEGNGFFVVRGEGDERYYTRAGDFNFDTNGYYTSPSGYRVQGWMADPVSGEIRMNAVAEDILITDAHETMQAKPTSRIDYAGILDTQASASRYAFKQMLTQASGTQSIFDLHPYKGAGTDMGLASGDSLRVKAHATGMTRFSEMANESGSLVNLSNGSQVIFRINDAPYAYKYNRNAADEPTNVDGEFSSMEGLVDEINDTLNKLGLAASGALARVENGSLVIDGGSTSFTIDSVTGDSTVLTSAFEDLSGTYLNAPKTSQPLYYQTELNAGEDFESLNDLAAEIKEAMNGHVISEGFNAYYMDNNFGLKDGDEMSMNVDLDGNTATLTLKYSATPLTATSDPDEFHTLTDLANAISAQLDAAAGGNHVVSVSADGNSLNFNYIGSSTGLVFSAIETFTPSAGATARIENASPYLEGLMQKLVGEDITPISKQIEVADISGKGRLAYANTNTALETITGFSIMESTTDSAFNNNILTQQDIDLQDEIGYAVSQQFLTEATEDTLMIDLFAAEDGIFSNFSIGTAIQLHAMVGGNKPTAADSVSIDADTTVGDMMTGIEEYLGLGREFNGFQNVTIQDGVISIVGEKGKANDISELTLTGIPESQLLDFNGRLGKPVKTAEASKGEYTTDMPVYDGQGNKHLVRFSFSLFNEERNEWAVRISTDEQGTTLNIPGATTNELIIKFNSDGTPSYIYDRQSNPTHVVSEPTLNLYPANGSNPVTGIDLNLGTTGQYDGLVLSAAPMSISKADQDGYPLGVLDEQMFNPAGEIVGYYSNGEIRTIGQVALATFQNNQGLLKVGDSMFAETGNSGAAAIGTPISGSRGQIAASALEQSNVDLSSEFVNMIVTERGFQANSRVVTTSDEMIQELLNLKR